MRALVLFVAILTGPGCAPSSKASDPAHLLPPANRDDAIAARASASSAPGGLAAPDIEVSAPPGRPDVVFTGMCDASAAVPLSKYVFAVADDEDNVLRVYDADRGGAPLYAKEISSDLGIVAPPSEQAGAPPGRPEEADIEAATRLGDTAFWLTSHGLSSSGRVRPERLRFFATSLPDYGKPLLVQGRVYTGLIQDLAADPRFAPFQLNEAARVAPKTAGGLNLEGMTDRHEGGVFIGFRNPSPQGRALLVTIENPMELIGGAPARFGAPLLLDLGGLGVRAMSSWHGTYLVVAGHFAHEAPSRLYVWDGTSAAPRLVDVGLADINPESFFTPEGRDEIMLLSDDGEVLHGQTPCKALEDANQKTFRGRWLKMAAPPPPETPGDR